MSDSKIHIIKLLMKPNLLVRKLNKDKEQRKALFAKKKKKKIELCISAICVTFSKILRYILAKQVLYIKL